MDTDREVMQKALAALLDAKDMLQRWDNRSIPNVTLATWFKLTFGGAGTWGNQRSKDAIALLQSALADDKDLPA